MSDVMSKVPYAVRYLVVALVVVLVVALVYLATGGGTKTGTAYFRFANSINPGDAVKVLGMDVGKVDKLTPEGDKVRVDFHYDSKYKLPADVKAAILSPTLVATRFIQLDPAYTSGPEFADGGTIPVERTAVPLEFDELKKQLDLISENFGPNGANKDGAINRFLTVIDKNGMQNGVGQGQPFHDMIVELSKAAKTLSDGRGDLFGTVDNLAHFAAVLNKYDHQIVTFQRNLGDVSKTLDDTSDDLKQAFTHLQGAGAPEVIHFLSTNRPALHETLDRLGSVTRAVARARDALAQTLHVAPNALTNFTNLIHPRTGQLYGALAIGYQNSLASPGNGVCALITQAAAANELTAQRTCAEALGPLFAQLVTMAPQIQTTQLPNIGVPGITLPQGSTPPYGDVDQRDHQPDTNPSPNGSNSDLPRSTTSDHTDQSFSDRFPVPLPTPNPHLGGN